MKIKYLFFLVFWVFVAGCHGIINSFDFVKLSDKYIYMHRFCLISDSRKAIIPPYVIEYEFNNDFIIALQMEYELDSNEIKKVELAKHPAYEEYKIALKKGIPKFWIIDIKTDSIYGPLNSDEYCNLRKELKIPTDLKLKIDIKL